MKKQKAAGLRCFAKKIFFQSLMNAEAVYQRNHSEKVF